MSKKLCERPVRFRSSSFVACRGHQEIISLDRAHSPSASPPSFPTILLLLVSDVISRWTIDLRSLERGRHRENSFEFFFFLFLFVSSFFGSNMNIICSTEKNNNVWNLEWERRKIMDLLFIIRILPNFSFHRKKSTLNKQHSVYPVCDSKIIFFNRLSLLIIRGT